MTRQIIPTTGPVAEANALLDDPRAARSPHDAARHDSQGISTTFRSTGP